MTITCSTCGMPFDSESERRKHLVQIADAVIPAADDISDFANGSSPIRGEPLRFPPIRSGRTMPAGGPALTRVRLGGADLRAPHASSVPQRSGESLPPR